MTTIIIPSKINLHTLGVTRQHTTDVIQYTVAYLEAQRLAIQAQKDRDGAQRDSELAEIDTLLDACAAMGILPVPSRTL